MEGGVVEALELDRSGAAARPRRETLRHETPASFVRIAIARVRPGQQGHSCLPSRRLTAFSSTAKPYKKGSEAARLRCVVCVGCIGPSPLRCKIENMQNTTKFDFFQSQDHLPKIVYIPGISSVAREHARDALPALAPQYVCGSGGHDNPGDYPVPRDRCFRPIDGNGNDGKVMREWLFQVSRISSPDHTTLEGWVGGRA